MHLPWVMGPLNLVNRGILVPNQVAALRALSALSNDGGTLHCDSWGVKKLFSYGCRRAGFDKSLSKSPQRRGPHLNQSKNQSHGF